MAVTSEVTAADIARIAGVGRAAVSNWRRRHPDFPHPIGGPTTSPTFALDEVQAWLQVNGRTQSVNTSERRSGQDARVATSLAALLPHLRAGIIAGIVDPTGGSGELLRAAEARSGPRVRYVAVTTPELADFRHVADAVIAAPPLAPIDTSLADHLWEFGPPNQMDGALAWLQLSFECVKPGGVAIVLMPFAAAVRASGRRIRAELLRSGSLRRVIALPQTTGVPLQIWVLERPAARPSYTIGMVDLSEAELPLDPDAWKAVFADPARSRDVPSIELLDDDVLLVPTTHIEPPQRDFVSELAAQTARYQVVAGAVPASAPTLAAGEPIRLPMATIADLARLGALAFADRQSPLESGDVVISGSASRFEATVVAAGSESPPRAEVIRCDPEQLDPHFVACFLRSETNRRQASGTLGGTFRLDVRRARIPRIPLAEQRPYAEAYRIVMDFAVRAQAVTNVAADLVRTAVDGLTAGALLPAIVKD